MNICPKILTVALLACLYAQNLSAKTGDTAAAIHISADKVQVDNHKQRAEYRGNVVYQQGSILVNAESIDIYTAKGKLKSATIDGDDQNRARFEQTLDNGQVIVGKAQNIVIDTVLKTIELNRDATLDDGNNQLSSEHISYDSVRQTIRANSEQSAGGKANVQKRVNMIFLPAEGAQ